MEMEYATKGKANAALTTGIIGTVGTGLALLANGFNFGGMGAQMICSDNVPITRYDSTLQARIAQLEQRNAILESENFTNSKIADLNDRYNDRFKAIENQIATQAVVNAQVSANLACTQNSLTALTNLVNGLTKTVIPITNICPEPAVATPTATA